MKKFLFAIALSAVATFAAVNKNLPGAKFQSGNDKPVVALVVDSLVGSADTGFVACGIGATWCNTNLFNSTRNPIPVSGNGYNTSSVVAANPDSIICNFAVMRKDADTSDFSYGVVFNLGTTASPLWSSYGATIASGGTNAALTRYRSSSPYVVGRQFKPFLSVTSTTDTIRVRFAECFDKKNP